MKRSTFLLAAMIALAASGMAKGQELLTKKSAGRVVEGRVIDEHQAPIASALVLVRAASSRFLPEGTARTDAEGRYHVDLTKTTWGAAKLQSVVLASGFAFATGTVEAGSGGVRADFTLKTEAWKTTEVRLADPSGKPAADVELNWSVGDRTIPWTRIKTDATGRCRIAMAIGQMMFLDARPPGARPVMAVLMNAKQGPAVINIPLLAPIRGRVHDAEGRSLPGVSVGRLIDFRTAKPRMRPHLRSPVATTDAEGRFELAPPLMLAEADFDRPGHRRPPGAICFADDQFQRLAFRVCDLSAPTEPLDITLEPGRLVRIPIESNAVYELPGAGGQLSFLASPRPALSTSDLNYAVCRLSREELIRGKPVEARLPGGKYKLRLECYITGVKSLGATEREVVVAPGEEPLELPALRLESTEHQKMVGKPAPEIEAIDRDTGRPIGLSDFRGKVVVLDFWGYWCGPCIARMPHLVALHRKFEGRPLAVIALHDHSVTSRAEYDRRTATTQALYWNGQDLPFRVLLDRPDPEIPAERRPEGTGATVRKYGIMGFPSVFVIDQQGIMVATVSSDDSDRLETLVRSLLDKTQDSPPSKRVNP